MTDDDVFETLGADWRRPTVDVPRLRQAIDRRRARAGVALLASGTGTLAALLSGVWFVRLGVGGAPPIFALAGVVMMLAFPLMGLELAQRVRSLGSVDDGTPAGMARHLKRQATTARKLLWSARAAAVLLAASAVGLTILQLSGRAGATQTLIYGSLWAVTAAAVWVWQRRRAGRLDAEIARCDLMLSELGASEPGAEAPSGAS